MTNLPSEFHSVIERVIGRAQSATAVLHVRSALNPMLWLCGIISLPALFGAWLASDVQPLATVLLVVGATPVLTSCAVFVYFSLFRPQNLRSEDYQIRHEAIELIKQKGVEVQLEPSSIVAIANPEGGDK